MKRPVRLMFIKTRFWIPILAGGFAAQLGGCDPTVRDTILTGVQTSLTGLVTAGINAFFMSLGESATSQAVVQVIHAVGQWFA